jgi:Calcineurin-like phosphoesterase
MRFSRRHTWTLAALPGLLLAGTLAAAALSAPAVSPHAPAAARVVAVGDIHGDAESFVAILKQAGLVDDQRKWTGGTATLVQTGDYFDRGEQMRAVLDGLMALEPQAAAAGGRAIVLFGNHEGMNVMREFRDVNPAVFASFADAQSEQRRERAWEQYKKVADARSAELTRRTPPIPVPAVYKPASREAWLEAHPPGWVEYVEALGPQGRYGKWLRARDVTVRIGDLVFMHGGLDPAIAPKKLDALNEQARREIERFDRMVKYMADRKIAGEFATLQELLDAGNSELEIAAAAARESAQQSDDPQGTFQRLMADHPLAELGRLGTWSLIATNGPVWFRGFATWTPEEGAAALDTLQKKYGSATRFVVGHTMPKTFRITPRFAGRVFLIDTGLSSTYREMGGRPSAIAFKDGTATAIYLDGRGPLEQSDSTK